MELSPQSPHFGKVEATVTYVADQFGYVLATDDVGNKYFCFHNAFERRGRLSFDDLQYGSRVRLRPVQAPRGLRGIEVEILTV
jgi:hypothetical protein